MSPRARRNVFETGERPATERSSGGAPTVVHAIQRGAQRPAVVVGDTVNQAVEDLLYALKKRLRPAFGFRALLSKRGQTFGDFGVRRRGLGGLSAVPKRLDQVAGGALQRPRLADPVRNGVEPAIELCKLLKNHGACRLTGKIAVEPFREILGQSIEGGRGARLDGRSQRLEFMIDGPQRAAFSFPRRVPADDQVFRRFPTGSGRLVRTRAP